MSKKILLADDDAIFRATIADGLRAAGYEIAVAADGLEAVEQVGEARPDCIILDLIMPKLDGIRACKLLKRHPLHRAIPVIILTGLGREGLQALEDLGAEATVAKRQADATLAEILKTLQLLESASLPPRPPAEAAQDLAERRIVNELFAERRHIQALLAAIGDGLVELDGAGRVVYVNPAGLQMLGHREEDLIGGPATHLFGPANVPTLERGLHDLSARAEGEAIRLELTHGPQTIGVTLTALGRPEGPLSGLLVLRDLTDLTRRARSLQALAAVGHDILGKLDLGTVLKQIVQRTAELLGAARCGLFRLEGAGGQLRLRCVEAVGLSEHFTRNLRIGPGEGVVGRVIAERRTVFTTDILRDPEIRQSRSLRGFNEAEQIGAVLAAPLVSGEEVFGTLVVYRPAGHRFSSEEIELVTSLAGSAAIAMENARLYGASEARRRAAEALAEVGRLLAQSLDPQEVAQRIAEAVRSLLGAQTSTLSALDAEAETLTVLAVAGEAEPPLGPRFVFPLGVGVAGLAAREGRPVSTPDVRADARITLPPELGARAEQGLFQAGLAMPLVRMGRVIGALAVGDRAGREFTPEEVRLAQVFADHAALALENARLYAEVRSYSQDLERRVAERTCELQTLNRELEMASRHKSLFLANMSHELRTPLHGVLCYTDLLLGAAGAAPGALNEKQRHFLACVHTSGERLLGLITDMLDLAKIEAGRLILALKEVPVRAALKEAITPAKLQALQQGLDLTLRLEEVPPTLTVDPQKFQQILGNLLANAIKFTPAGGTITVEARGVPDSRGGALEVSVRDTGIGIAPEDQGRLFQEFEQLDNSLAKRHQGTGLGLALTGRLVELHRGRIWASSPGLGRGATFTIRLPCRPEPLTGKVLVVDDDRDARAAIRDVLAARGLEVQEAVDGLQALDMIAQALPDVLLLDLHLPLMHGYRVIRDLRRRPETATLAILVVTGLGREDGRVAVEQGADAYLTKPFKTRALTEAVDRLLERRGAPALVEP